MKRAFILLLYLLLASTKVIGQVLSGHWTGGLRQNDKLFVFKTEIDILQDGDQLSGQSKFIDNTGEWVIESFKGRVVGARIYLNEQKVIKDSSPKNWSWCIKKFVGKKSISGNVISISGSWTSDMLYSEGTYSAGSCSPGRFTISKSLPGQKARILPAAPVKVSPPATMKAVSLNKGITLKNVIFETAKDVLLPSSQPELDQLVKLLESQKRLHVRIDGYTDKVGDSAKNLKLSQQRAQVIKTYLMQHGVAAARIETNGYGDSHTICSVPCEANRRVEFTLSD